MAMYINPLDFETIFIGYFLGGTKLFIAALFLLISYSCAKYQIDDKYYLSILGLASILFGVYIGEGIYMIVLFMVSVLIMLPLRKIVSR